MKKPVLTIFYQFNPWYASIGGIQTIIRTFIKYAPEEFEVRLAGTGHDSAQPIGKWQDAEFEGRELKFIPLFTVKNDDVRKLIPTSVRYTLALFARRLDSDFMHFHRLEPTLATLNWVGEKTLFVHNDIRQQIAMKGGKRSTILWQRFPQLFQALERSLIGQFNHVYSCNTESLKYYQHQYPTIANRISYLKNTVDTGIFYPLPLEQQNASRRNLAKQLGLPDDKRFILFAGRLHPQKNPLLLVRSIAALKVLDAHLLIAGDGEMARDVQLEIERLNLSSRITMMGSLDQSQLARLQQICSVFVLTSLYEGLPVTVLEALACGTPVVTTRCGETPNLLTPGSGLVCSDYTEAAVADALHQVLSRSQNYPIEACLRAAAPYAAQAVVHEIFDDMLKRWHVRSQFSTRPSRTSR